MYIIVGLGNPEEKYDRTRHNVGFEVIDRLSEEYNIPVETKKHKALMGIGMIEGEKVVLMKPQTFMNLSGEAIREVAEYYQVPTENVMVICDDIYLKTGVLRIRPSGSAGGHNGLKNIILHLAGEDFPRFRVGVGLQPENEDRIHFVLSKINKEDWEKLEEVFERTAKAVVVAMQKGIPEAGNRFNGEKH